ncbi:histidinol-phosphatase [Tenacibaculum pacificus]|uniref:histidinol-phosphatase n=1 Tax=Tenacibaculum TaxID=104267 RepID=UPI0022F3F75E|nr:MULTISPECIES: histidinol-phosphatase [Tenacibaculum]WBX72939.1 histidinol-phosphatase [Tenacibaculum pacificus]WCC46246.1 histidinol-phosphatase [Tenacibaculum finnmarkense]
MKKIDLHIHTISTVSDYHFDFDLSKLKEYIEKLEIDCIAITNHNTFDFNQYNTIKDNLDIIVFPGIEIDLERGHLLVISDNDDLSEINDFSKKCKRVNNLIETKDDYITLDEFKDIFPNLDKYLVIPHYHKKPIIKPKVIEQIETLITAGEVSSYKKFKTCIKDSESLVPVIFSDSRYFSEMKNFSTQQTWVDLEEITLSGIKSCLTDKQKVFLTKEEGNEFFRATAEGLMLSTGLNVILGQRSTGKTVTLNKIHNTHENIKYIKQFSLLQDDAQKFEELLSRRHSSVSEDYLKEFKKVVDSVKDIDLKQNEVEIENYLNSLLKFASDNEKADAYSNTKLFSENHFGEKDLLGLKKLINATVALKENTEYKTIINRHLNAKSLESLELDLMKEYIEIEESNLKKDWVNTLITKVKDELRFRTSSSIPTDVDFYRTLIDNEKIKKFITIVNNIKSEKEIDKKEIRGFKIVASTKRFSNASHLKKVCSRQISLVPAFNKYHEPYSYLLALKKAEIEDTEIFKYFVDIEYKTLNKLGFPVSGGERSEFNLLHEINDALKHNMLLIDEPESSFDNIFLKNEVNELLRDISKSIPVIIVTHNSTVGASIKPNFIACTKREIVNGEIEYKTFSGFPADKQLKSVDGETIDNFEIMLNCLEAGQDEYNRRRNQAYEILKN